jgi:steroid delta-isomerase-like uncharacterized protein
MVSAEDSTTLERVIDDWARHWSSHDLDRLLPLFTDDVVFEDVAQGAVHRGKDGLRAFAERVFAGFPDVALELTSRFATGNQGGGEWVMRGTNRGDSPGMPATGKRVELRGASIFEFASGKIRRYSDYWDMATFLKQLGLMPSGE